MTRTAGALQLAIVIGAGLATGLAHFPDPLAVSVAALAAAWLTRQWPHLTLALALTIAVASGSGLRSRATASCAARLPLGLHTVALRLVDPGAGTGRVLPVAAGCQGEVRARWPHDRLIPAGTTAMVSARWLPRRGLLGRPDGTLQITRVDRISGTPGLLARSRTAVARSSALLFGDRAGLVDALIAGRTGGIAPEVRDRFAAAGLIHVLSISGFHMGLIAFWLLLLLRLSGVATRHAELVAIVVVLGYTAWLGWPPPATRAAALLTVAVMVRRRQRAVQPAALLGASALVVLVIDPWSVVDLGAWLSFAAMAGVLWAAHWCRRVATPHPTLEAVAGSLGATLATAPIAALTIGRVAAIGPVVNLVALPIAALLVPAICAALLVGSLAPPLAVGFAASATVLLALLDRVAAIGAGLPGAAGIADPGWQAALPWCALLLLATHATRGGASPREALRRTGWGASLLVWWPLIVSPNSPSQGDGRLTLHFLDVGQGDAALIRTPAGHWIAIDAGPADERYDAGARVVAPFLERHGAPALAMLVVSHGHRDHVGGAAALTSRIPIGMVLEPGEPFDDSWYLRWLDSIAAHQVRWKTARPGLRWQLDGVSFEVIHPASDWPGRGLDLNEDSVVLLVRYGEFAALFTGDAGVPAESFWQAQVGRLDLLKVGHHGSAGATGAGLLQSVQPRVAVISSGRNRYGHPAPATLDRLASAGVATWRTDREGTVSVETDGRTFRVRGGRTAARYDARDPLPETPTCCTRPR